MKGLRVGYIRVSTLDQKIDRQLESIPLDKKFTDYASGRTMERPQFNALIGFVREGDIVIVHSMDRLARNLDHLRNIIDSLTRKGVSVQFVKENLTFNADSDPLSKLMLSVMGAFSEFEVALIRERQREGISIAKAKGKYMGRKALLNEDQIKQLKDWVAQGMAKTWIAKQLNINRVSIYSYLKKSTTKEVEHECIT